MTINRLSPQKELFEQYRANKKQLEDQNQAFELTKYQQKFKLTTDGLQNLQELVELSKKQDVYMICQCKQNERCHVDLMLLIAKTNFGAKIGELPYKYSEFLSGLLNTK
jgi:uncharacterized protein YeaO (DUF488 family)